ncbi:hypothetical protein HY636_00785 [Candidatus Woesearchaeota archaeon]|nr:hypothetical protein [Candidatus Woesearchaeota archaeon]
MEHFNLERIAKHSDSSQERTDAVNEILKEFDKSKNIGSLIEVLKWGEHEDTSQKIMNELRKRKISRDEHHYLYGELPEIQGDLSYVAQHLPEKGFSYVVYEVLGSPSKDHLYHVRIPTIPSEADKTLITRVLRDLPQWTEFAEFSLERVSRILSQSPSDPFGIVKLPNLYDVADFIRGEKNNLTVDDGGLRRGEDIRANYGPRHMIAMEIEKMLNSSPRLAIRYADYRNMIGH